MTDPYAILGLSRSASLEDIKQKYRALARQHHPDKLGHLSPDERAIHESYFKKVTVAYKFLVDHARSPGADGTSDASGAGGGDADGESWYDPKLWHETWSKIEERMNADDILQTMTSFFKTSIFDAALKYSQIKKAAAASEGAKTPDARSLHKVTMSATLSDIHMRKKRKVRLFLKHEPEPLFVVVDCGQYPKCNVICNTEDDREVQVEITMTCAHHRLYSVMDYEASEAGFNPYEMYCEVCIDLQEYFLGCTKEMPYLDQSTLFIEIPAMPNLYEPIRIDGKGLQGRGDLLVGLRLEPRQKVRLENLPPDKKEIFLETISGAAGA